MVSSTLASPTAKSLVILNPVSGRGEAAKIWPKVAAELGAAGVRFDVAPTRAPLHAVDLASKAPAQGYTSVLAAGGDGLVHEVMNGLMLASGEHATTPLGIIPLGSGNDLNKMLPPACTVGGTRNDWRAAVQTIAGGKTAMFDVGKLKGDIAPPGRPSALYFTNVMDVGFGASVAMYAKSMPKFFKGTPMYVASAFKSLLNYQVPKLKITLDDGRTIEQRSTITAVANARCFGGGFWIAPEADLADGCFDLVVAKDLGRLAVLPLVMKVMKGTHVGHPALHFERTTRVTIDSPDPMVVEADGEIPFVEAHHLEIEMLRQRLRVLA